MKTKEQRTVVQHKVAIYRRDVSGIGSRFVRYEYVTSKPNYDTNWFDCTNGEWARYDARPFNRNSDENP